MTATIQETEKHMLSIPDATGDSRIMWDPRDPDEVKLAERHFKDALKKGMAAFKVDKSGGTGEQIRAFDPNAGKIIMVKQLQGG